MMLIAKSKVKAFIKEAGARSSGAAIDAVNEMVQRLCAQAVAKAKSDKRMTVKPEDVTGMIVPQEVGFTSATGTVVTPVHTVGDDDPLEPAE